MQTYENIVDLELTTDSFKLILYMKMFYFLEDRYVKDCNKIHSSEEFSKAPDYLKLEI